MQIVTPQDESIFGSCHLTCEPSERPVGKMIREIFSGKLPMDNLVVAGLFVADRLDHLVNKEDGIINLLGQNTHVISDRYYLSSMAYQSVFAPMEWILKANDQARQMLKADITFTLTWIPKKVWKELTIAVIQKKSTKKWKTSGQYTTIIKRLWNGRKRKKILLLFLQISHLKLSKL